VSEEPFGRRAVFVDSSAFLAFASIRDENHKVAGRIQSRLEAVGTRLVTTTYVLAELHALSMARRGSRFALDLLDRIEQGSTLIVHVREEDWQGARSILRRYDDKSFSLTDALSFAVMDRLSIADAFTFDRHFLQYGLRVIEDPTSR
jgi:predicted nucleic acid-binding protein